MFVRRSLGLVALVAALGLPTIAAAQTAPVAPAAGAPAHRGHHGWMSRVRALDLSADQKAQIKAFAADARAKSKNADPATRKQIHQQLRSQVEGILTPSQRQQLQASAPQAPAK